MKKFKNNGFLYILPWILGFILFKMYPIIYSLILSFTDGNILGKPQFTGFENYIRAFSDKDVIKSFAVTVIYAFIEVPLKLMVSLLVAQLLSARIKGMGFFRTAYYIPTILGSNIAAAVLWKYLFSSKGYANQLLAVFGIEPVSWFGEPFPALMTVILLRVWEFGSSMVIFLAGINEVPKELYEAAEIDGCSRINRFFRITVPMIRHLIFFNFIMQMIQAFQEFNAPYMITGGNPLNFTYLISMLIYDNSFIYFDMGYASAVSWILLIVLAVPSAIMIKKYERDGA
ncbi:MAG TPA: sugar ABC transporter permease [Ruminococcus sp.]|nr:sugar ABC transporter permease [Ruminococcus sp.]HBN10909.1 sugar ABC transporter permease [Ruminococcus sp.]HCR73614.1 sugar ABC transporter permease [Ruminococcus sp.]